MKVVAFLFIFTFSFCAYSADGDDAEYLKLKERLVQIQKQEPFISDLLDYRRNQLKNSEQYKLARDGKTTLLYRILQDSDLSLRQKNIAVMSLAETKSFNVLAKLLEDNKLGWTLRGYVASGLAESGTYGELLYKVASDTSESDSLRTSCIDGLTESGAIELTHKIIYDSAFELGKRIDAVSSLLRVKNTVTSLTYLTGLVEDKTLLMKLREKAVYTIFSGIVSSNKNGQLQFDGERSQVYYSGLEKLVANQNIEDDLRKLASICINKIQTNSRGKFDISIDKEGVDVKIIR